MTTIDPTSIALCILAGMAIMGAVLVLLIRERRLEDMQP